MKSTLLSIILTLISWIPSFGQASDTIKCYTEPELRKIATLITEGSECKDLLETSSKRLQVQDSLILNYQQEVNNYKALIPLKDTVSVLQEQKINSLNDQLKTTRKHWLYSSAGLFTLIVLLIL